MTNLISQRFLREKSTFVKIESRICMISVSDGSTRSIAYELERKRVKNINLRIRSDGSMFVSASPRVSQKTIDYQDPFAA